MFILIRLPQHVSGIIMPIIRRTDYVNNCTWSMPGCVGYSRAELGHELCAHELLDTLKFVYKMIAVYGKKSMYLITIHIFIHAILVLIL